MIGRLFRIVSTFPIGVIGLLRKEYDLLFTKKKYLYLSILLPIILSIIYIYTLTGNGAVLDIMICDYDNTALTKEALDGFDGFNINKNSDIDCESTLKEEIRDRKYLFGLVIERGFTERLINLKQSEIFIYYDNSNPSVASLATWKIDSALGPIKKRLVYSLVEEVQDKSTSAKDKTEIALGISEALEGDIFNNLKMSIKGVDQDLERMQSLDPAFVTAPIISNANGVYEKYKTLDVGIAPLYGMLSMFMLLMLCSTGVMYDRKMKLFFRIRASNSSMIGYLLSKIMFFFAVAVAQFIFILIVFFAFGARYEIGWILLLKALLFVSLVNTLIGVLIGLISDSEGVAVLFSLIITLPLLLLSGMFYPIEFMPKIMQFFAKIMPLDAEVLMIKKALIFGGTMNNFYFIAPLVLAIICLWFLRKK